MARRIGIKYCGGCNPTYERAELVERLRAELGDQVTFARYDEPFLDGLLFVCGCETACVMDGQGRETSPVFSIRMERDMQEAIHWFRDWLG